jgi:hypothetical protein
MSDRVFSIVIMVVLLTITIIDLIAYKRVVKRLEFAEQDIIEMDEALCEDFWGMEDLRVKVLELECNLDIGKAVKNAKSKK